MGRSIQVWVCKSCREKHDPVGLCRKTPLGEVCTDCGERPRGRYLHLVRKRIERRRRAPANRQIGEGTGDG